jgi:hypothetical protein
LAKFKPIGARKPKAQTSKQGLIPCLVILAIGFVLVALLLYEVMKSG